MNFQARSEEWIAARHKNIQVLLVLAAGLAVLAMEIAERWSWEWWAAAAAAAAALITQAIAAIVKRRSDIRKGEAEIEAEAEFVQSLEYLLAPVVRTVSEISRKAPDERASQFPELCMQVVSAASQLPGTTGVRASIYTVGRDGKWDAFVPHKRFVVGRTDLPRTTFARNRDAEGLDVWLTAEAGKVRFCEDWMASPPPGMDTSIERAYRTFITAPIMSARVPVGLLTINAALPGDLSQTDVSTMSVLAGLLATGYGMCGTVWPDGA